MQRTYSYRIANKTIPGSSPNLPLRSGSFSSSDGGGVSRTARHSAVITAGSYMTAGPPAHLYDRESSSTPTNFLDSQHLSSNPSSSRSMISPEEELKEVIVLAEKGKSEKLTCPLCSGVFRDPHIATCGHTFCSPCLRSGREESCPLDGVALSMVVRNLAVAEQVGELLIHCQHGCRPIQDGTGEYEVDPTGCPMIIKLACREEHESECDYAPIRCPNSSICSPVLKKDLTAHLKVCRHVRCPHHRFNCLFQGTKEELVVHLEKCKFEGLKGYLTRTDECIIELQTEIKRKDEEITFLRSMLGSLSEKVEYLEKTALGKIGQLDERQQKIQKEVVDAKNGVSFVTDELQHVQVQLGVAGTMDSQHLFKCKGTFVGHSGPVWALCIVGDLLFSGSSDNTIKVWDTGTGFKCVQTLLGHDGLILALCSYGEQYLYSGSADQSIKLWDLEQFDVVSTIEAHDNPVCTLTAGGDRLYSGSLKTIKVWDTATNQLVKELPAQNHWVRALVVSDRFLYSGSYQAVKIWTLESLECIQVLECPGGSVYSLCVTNYHIICGTYENKINVWNIETLESAGELTGHVGIVYALQAIEVPGQTKLFSASYDKTLRVWNTDHMTCAQTLIRHESSVTCLAMSRGRLFSGSVDSTIKVWQ